MPKVGNKHFAYTPEGIAKAEEHAKSTGTKVEHKKYQQGGFVDTDEESRQSRQHLSAVNPHGSDEAYESSWSAKEAKEVRKAYKTMADKKSFDWGKKIKAYKTLKKYGKAKKYQEGGKILQGAGGTDLRDIDAYGKVSDVARFKKSYGYRS